MKLALNRGSLLLLLLQLAIVSSIAAKYLYQRQHCPRVWTRAVAYDPDLILRGRYLSMQLHVDACGVQLPPQVSINNSINATFQQVEGMNTPNPRVEIGAKDGRLVVTSVYNDWRNAPSTHSIYLRKGESCHNAVLTDAVDYYIPEHAESPFPLKQGAYLWVELTIPPKGPPRPIQLALNKSGAWSVLPF